MVDVKTVEDLAPDEVLELIGSKLLGWRRSGDGWMVPDAGSRAPWNPFESKDDAWMIVAALNARGWLVIVKCMPEGSQFILGNCAVSDPKLARRAVCELYWMGETNSVSPAMILRRPEATWDDTVERAILNTGLLVLAIEEEAGFQPSSDIAESGSGRQGEI